MIRDALKNILFMTNIEKNLSNLNRAFYVLWGRLCFPHFRGVSEKRTENIR